MESDAGSRDGDAAAVASLLATIRDLVAELDPRATGDRVSFDARLDTDLGLDSLAVAELLVRVEELFDVSLDEGVLATVETPRDLLAEVATATGRPLPAGAGAPPPSPGPVTAADAPRVPVDADTLLDVLDRYATADPDRTHLRLLGAGQVEDLTYGELHLGAAAVAAGLRQRRVPAGSAVAIMLPTSTEYFVAFFGALLAGCVPTPVYPPGRPSGLEDHLRRHVAILRDARAAALITVPAARSLSRLVAPQVPTLDHVVTVDELREDSTRPPRSSPSASATALLQYTSGSTGDPKGVVLSHTNLLANIRGVVEVGSIGPGDVFVSWLPLYHDMGLIGSWLLSLYAGIPFVVMSPVAFLTRPVRWLRAIHDHGGTISGGPNFGFELCLHRIGDDDLEGLDLTSWRVAFNGAEPVSPETVVRFVDRFAPYGLSPGAITPVYGLAESSVALTVPEVGRGAVIDRVARDPLARSGRALPAPADDPTAARFVACGPPLPGHEVRIATADGTTLGERQEGRVQFRGPSATSGYLRAPEATRRMVVDGWLDSGDLGYFADGELYLTGRRKDVIIRAGRNLHPSGIEAAVGAVEGVRKGCVAAFATTDRASATERLVVVAETRATGEGARDAIRRAVTEATTDVVGTPPDEVVLAPPGAVPKTSSGKVRRGAARERYERGGLEPSRAPAWWQLTRVAGSSLSSWLRRAGPGAVHAAYGLYALAVFVAISAVVWPLVMVLPTPRHRWRLVRRAGRILLRVTGVRLTVVGTEHLPSTGPYVVVANHASFLDPLVLALIVPEPLVFAAVGGLAQKPVVRLFLRRMDAHLVERGDRVRGVSDTRVLTEVVRGGRSSAFFPEGRRSPAPGLEPFQVGAFQVAADAGVPVVPIALTGTRGLLPVERKLPRWGAVTATITPPALAPVPGWEGAVELRGRAREAIVRHCDEPDLG